MLSLLRVFIHARRRSLVMPRSRVITSMAVKDDLMAGESYFIREIRYLRRILDSLDEEKMTLCAIDEILRGTNTGERIRAIPGDS